MEDHSISRKSHIYTLQTLELHHLSAFEFRYQQKTPVSLATLVEMNKFVWITRVYYGKCPDFAQRDFDPRNKDDYTSKERLL